MDMAQRVAELYAGQLRYSDGTPVECVVADRCIGGVKEAAMAAEKFSVNNVCAVVSVTPCWCYGAETIDMDPLMPKAIWGFNGTERPGAVYLASALAGHNQKGLPAFGIYGRDVQDMGDRSIPEDVREKLLRFGRAAVAVGQMRGKSYLSIGSVSMGIAGSIPDPAFFQEYLGMRSEYVDASEIERRVRLGIYDPEEFRRAMAWTEKYCKKNEGRDYNPEHLVYSREEKDAIWEYVVKMTLIFRDLMTGNPKLAGMGFEEEAMGHNAIAGGFQGQRQWTDYKPRRGFLGGDTQHLVRLERHPRGLHLRHGERYAERRFDAADAPPDQPCPAVRRRAHVLESRVRGACDRPETGGRAADGIIHLINSGSCCLDATGRQSENGQPVMKPFWEITEAEAEACLGATTWYPASREYMRGGGYSSCFLTQGDMPVTMCRLNLIKGQGPVLQIAEGWAVNVDREIFETINRRTDKTWPTTWFAPRLTGKGAFRDVYSVMNSWGANHGAISYGHIGADLVTLASMLRIPVCMHNLDETGLFRPSAWAAFGMDPEGADYRACENYGPIYR